MILAYFHRSCPSAELGSAARAERKFAATAIQGRKPVTIGRHLPTVNGDLRLGVKAAARSERKLAATATQGIPVTIDQLLRTSNGDLRHGVKAELPASSQTPPSTVLYEEKGVVEMLKTLQSREIPDYYVKPDHLRSNFHGLDGACSGKLEGDGNQIPVVDLASPHSELVRSIRRACEGGFFQIVNHGTNPELLERILQQSKHFFSLPIEEKLYSTTAEKVSGPIHFGGGSRGDWRDVLKINFAPPAAVAMDLWPRHPTGFSEILKTYVDTQRVLAQRLFDLISESVGLEKEYVANECNDPRILMAINHYPPCPDPSLTIGIREHSDPNTLTILLQDEVGGLEVFKDGSWFNVEPLPGALVVNMGDHMQVLTNGRYRSCVHRVRTCVNQPRTSIALFFSPALTSLIKPAPALVDEDHPLRYRAFIYKEFLKDFYQSGGPNRKVVLSKFKT